MRAIRLIVRSIAPAVLLAVVSACGSSSSGGSRSPVATPTLSDDVLAAASNAASVSLPGLSDLPAGWTAQPHDSSDVFTGFTGDCAPLNADDLVSGSVASKISDDFSGASYHLTTYADVFLDAGDAKRSMSTLSHLMTDCRQQIETVFAGTLKESGASTDVHVTFGELQTTRIGDDTRAYHAAFAFGPDGSGGSLATDVIVVRSGAIIVSVVVSSNGRDNSLVLGLARTLAGRMALANIALANAIVAATPVPTLSDPDYLDAAKAAASSVTLRLADLPAGWSVDTSPGDSAGPDLTGECAPLNGGGFGPASTVSRSSADFTGPYVDFAASFADVFKSTPEAEDLMNMVGDLLRRCKDQMTSGLAGVASRDGMSDVHVSAVELPRPALADDAYDYRFDVDGGAGGRHLSFFLDMLFMRKGPIVVSLVTVTDDPARPLTSDLARLLSDRMTAAADTLIPQPTRAQTH